MHKISSAKTPPQKKRWVIKGADIIVDSQRVYRNGWLALDGDKVAGVGSQNDPAAAAFSNWEAWDGRGFVLTPGLVNAHSHVAMGFFRGLAHGQENMIEQFFFPAERRLTPELVTSLCYGYIYDGLRSGTTTFIDHYYFAEQVAAAFERMGLRAGVGLCIADQGGAFPSSEAWLAEKRRIDNWPYSTRITPVVSPHATDTVSPKLLSAMGQFAVDRDLPLHLHLAQTAAERKRILELYGRSPVAHAEQLGILNGRTLAVHLVATDTEDVRRLRSSGATAVLCPASQILYERLAPLELFCQNGLPMAIGTDCAASNDGADLFAEARLTALLSRDRGAPLSPKQIFDMLTVQPHAILGWKQRVGRLDAGYQADLVFIRKGLDLEPIPDLHTHMIYSIQSRHVEHVMVDGAFALWRRKTVHVDLESIRAEYLRAVERMHQTMFS